MNLDEKDNHDDKDLTSMNPDDMDLTFMNPNDKNNPNERDLVFMNPYDKDLYRVFFKLVRALEANRAYCKYHYNKQQYDQVLLEET